jgi:hypothetical protein
MEGLERIFTPCCSQNHLKKEKTLPFEMVLVLAIKLRGSVYCWVKTERT